MKKRRKILVSIGVVLALGCSIIGTINIARHIKINSKSKQNRVFNLAEVHGADYPTSMANQRFADLVKEKTEGKIQIEVYTDGVLGEETEVIKEMQKGTIAFGRVSIGPLAEYVDSLNALMLPYLYQDSKHMWKVLDSPLGEGILESLGEVGLTGLAWYDSGARSFYLKEGIVKKEELQNKKIRVQKNSLMYAMCEALGVWPQSLPESEIYLAILEGSLDGAENNIPTYETYKQYEVCNYYILDEHTRIPDMLMVSDVIMEQLSKENQRLIREAAKEAGMYERMLWDEREQEATVRLKEKGIQFITLSGETKAQLKKACDSLYDEFGYQYEAIIKQIEAMAE